MGDRLVRPGTIPSIWPQGREQGMERAQVDIRGLLQTQGIVDFLAEATPVDRLS